jgi:hypothetical protein
MRSVVQDKTFFAIREDGERASAKAPLLLRPECSQLAKVKDVKPRTDAECLVERIRASTTLAGLCSLKPFVVGEYSPRCNSSIMKYSVVALRFYCGLQQAFH